MHSQLHDSLGLLELLLSLMSIRTMADVRGANDELVYSPKLEFLGVGQTQVKREVLSVHRQSSFF